MKQQGIVYRCSRLCPIHKRCFVVKLESEPKQPLIVLHKCEASKRDVKIEIGMKETGEYEQ